MSTVSASLSKTEQVKSASYEMPRAYIGMPILWYQGGNKSNKPYPGLVTDVGRRSIDLVFFAPGSTGVHSMTGVRHIDDPDTKAIELYNAGAWETPKYEYKDEHTEYRG